MVHMTHEDVTRPLPSVAPTQSSLPARTANLGRNRLLAFRRWSDAGCFEALVSDMRSLIRVSQGRQSEPSAVIFDGRTLAKQLRKRRARGLLNSYKRRKGFKVHMAVDTLGTR